MSEHVFYFFNVGGGGGGPFFSVYLGGEMGGRDCRDAGAMYSSEKSYAELGLGTAHCIYTV